MKEILTSSDHVILIDDADYDLVSSRRWYVSMNVRKGTKTDIPKAIYASMNNKKVALSRLITNAPAGMYVDHINGDVLDNRRANLRVVTNAENLRNRGKTSANKTGFKGVYKHAKSGKYRAVIGVNYKPIHLGEFPTAELAGAAYMEAARKYHGEFVRCEHCEVSK